MLEVTFTIAGDISSFDEPAFQTALAAQFDGVRPNDIELQVFSASIIVKARIILPSAAAADAASTMLSSNGTAVLSAALSLPVERVTRVVVSYEAFVAPSPPPPSSPPSPPPPSALDAALATATAHIPHLTFSLVVSLLTYCLWRRDRAKRIERKLRRLGAHRLRPNFDGASRGRNGLEELLSKASTCIARCVCVTAPMVKHTDPSSPPDTDRSSSSSASGLSPAPRITGNDISRISAADGSSSSSASGLSPAPQITGNDISLISTDTLWLEGNVSQYTLEGGESACTAIAFVAAIELLAKYALDGTLELDESQGRVLIDDVVTRGVMLAGELPDARHASFEEVVNVAPAAMREAVVVGDLRQVLLEPAEEARIFIDELSRISQTYVTDSGSAPSIPFAVVLTALNQTILLIDSQATGIFLLFDSHPLPHLGLDNAYIRRFQSREALCRSLAQSFPAPPLDPDANEAERILLRGCDLTPLARPTRQEASTLVCSAAVRAPDDVISGPSQTERDDRTNSDRESPPRFSRRLPSSMAAREPIEIDTNPMSEPAPPIGLYPVIDPDIVPVGVPVSTAVHDARAQLRHAPQWSALGTLLDFSGLARAVGPSNNPTPRLRPRRLTDEWITLLSCPITAVDELMVDPVCTSDGRTYERENIQRYWHDQEERMAVPSNDDACCPNGAHVFVRLSPSTNQAVSDTLQPNALILQLLQNAVDNGMLSDEETCEWRQRREQAQERQRCLLHDSNARQDDANAQRDDANARQDDANANARQDGSHAGETPPGVDILMEGVLLVKGSRMCRSRRYHVVLTRRAFVWYVEGASQPANVMELHTFTHGTLRAAQAVLDIISSGVDAHGVVVREERVTFEALKSAPPSSMGEWHRALVNAVRSLSHYEPSADDMRIISAPRIARWPMPGVVHTGLAVGLCHRGDWPRWNEETVCCVSGCNTPLSPFARQICRRCGRLVCRRCSAFTAYSFADAVMDMGGSHHDSFTRFQVCAECVEDAVSRFELRQMNGTDRAWVDVAASHLKRWSDQQTERACDLAVLRVRTALQTQESNNQREHQRALEELRSNRPGMSTIGRPRPLPRVGTGTRATAAPTASPPPSPPSDASALQLEYDSLVRQRQNLPAGEEAQIELAIHISRVGNELEATNYQRGLAASSLTASAALAEEVQLEMVQEVLPRRSPPAILAAPQQPAFARLSHLLPLFPSPRAVVHLGATAASRPPPSSAAPAAAAVTAVGHHAANILHAARQRLERAGRTGREDEVLQAAQELSAAGDALDEEALEAGISASQANMQSTAPEPSTVPSAVPPSGSVAEAPAGSGPEGRLTGMQRLGIVFPTPRGRQRLLNSEQACIGREERERQRWEVQARTRAAQRERELQEAEQRHQAAAQAEERARQRREAEQAERDRIARERQAEQERLTRLRLQAEALERERRESRARTDQATIDALRSGSVGLSDLRMCRRCRAGPVENDRCPDLNERNRNNCNRCPACGWFSPKWHDWPMWDGVYGRH